jgi:hypothetical protein
MADLILLVCDACGNAVTAERQPFDPPNAVQCVTNECSVCHAASGGFGESWYYDAAGTEIRDDPATFMGTAQGKGTE